jgi:transposase
VPKYERKVTRPTKLVPFESYLREMHQAAQPDWIPATVLYRAIAARGYEGGMSRMRSFMRTLQPTEPVVRVERKWASSCWVSGSCFAKAAHHCTPSAPP